MAAVGDEFIEAVAEMRRVQKAFFAGERTRDVVGRAKQLERRVDVLLAELLGEARPAEQLGLLGVRR